MRGRILRRPLGRSMASRAPSSLFAPRPRPNPIFHSLDPFALSFRSLFVTTHDTPNPDSLKFKPGIDILPEVGTYDFPTALSASTSPLAKTLFRLDGVKRVFVAKDFVTVTKEEREDWDEMKPLVFATLMEFFDSGDPAVTNIAPPTDTLIREDDPEHVAMIKELIETRIRPSVQDDGGDITYLGFVDGVVFLQMQGSCSGCPSSSITLRNGIENMMKHWIPEVNGVVAVDTMEEFEQLTGGAPAIREEAAKSQKANREAFSKVDSKIGS